jgi:Ser/Thr protein kinase RdoA (MazF antagonist)
MQQELFAYISDIYNISQINTISAEMITGTLSVSSIVSDGKDRYFLKEYDKNFTEDRVAEVHKVKKYFSDGGIPILKALMNKLGKTYFTYDGHFYALFPFVDGKHLYREAMPPEAIVSMGAMLGKIHALGVNPGFEISKRFQPWDSAEFMQKAKLVLDRIQAKNNKDSFDLIALESVQTKMALVEKYAKPFSALDIGVLHLIHGDYHDHNLFFNEKNEVSYVFDFEKCDMSPRMYELMRSIHYTCIDGTVTEEKVQTAMNYLKAYHSVYPVTQKELKSGIQLYFMKAIHSLWVVDEYYINDNERSIIFFKNSLETINYLKDNIEDFTKKLSSVL